MKIDGHLSRGSYRVALECSVLFEGPVHSGSGTDMDLVSDAPLLRDAAGKPWVTAASVRGVLRDWCERECSLVNVTPEVVGRLFGRAGAGLHDDVSIEETMRAVREGRLTTFALELEHAPAAVRDHVRIDRTLGTAAHGGKFDLEAAEPERGVLRLQYEGDGPEDPELVLLAHVVQALQSGLLSFAARSAWGYGYVRAVSQTWRVVDRSTSTGLSSYLMERLAGTQDSRIGAVVPPPVVPVFVPARPSPGHLPWAELQLWVELQFEGPFAVGDMYRGADPYAPSARAHRSFRTDARGRPSLPGESLRGPLRTYAARLGELHGMQNVVDRAFGPELPVAVSGSEPDEGAPDTMAAVGAVRETAPRPLARGRVSIGPGVLVSECRTYMAMHNRIDRTTGGSLGLFMFESLASPRFRLPVRIRWQPTLAQDDLDAYYEELAVPALVLATLSALGRGEIAVGAEVTRGSGEVVAMSLHSAISWNLRECPNDMWQRTIETFTSLDEVIAALEPNIEACAVFEHD